MKSLRTPIQASRAYAIAERRVRTVPRECLDHLITPHRAHLREIVTELVHYDNHDYIGAINSRISGLNRSRPR